MLRKIIFFFPLQLLLVNLKRNHLLLLLWIILFGFAGKTIALKYGIPYLFLAPEYLDVVSFWSYFIMGFSIGGFVMVYNISSYIINSKRFPFIATLKRPFVKFCINNSLLPLIFMIYYLYQVVNYHILNENTSTSTIMIYLIAIVLGYTFIILTSLTYFLSTNKNIFKILGITQNESNTPINTLFSKEESIYKFLKGKNKWHVGLYLHSPFKVRYVRDIQHYDTEILKSIISQNKINATFFEVVIFISLILIGFLSENKFFVIPAGASIVLVFTIIFILTSAFYTWLKGWTSIILVGIVLLINYGSRYPYFGFNNMAYGLNYENKKADYSLKNIFKLNNNTKNFNSDKKNAIQILNNWKNKNSEKPKIIFINTSGGGSRATMWTFYMLQYMDSISNGKFFNQTHLITGSSGGMIGAAYYRELYLQRNNIEHSLYSDIYLKNTGKDLLNPIAFSIATNDWFFRLKEYSYDNYQYKKDRGFAFEKQLNINTHQILNKKLHDYTEPEYKAIIPQMILSPTVINDGRRMLIASQPISFMSYNKIKNYKSSIENFEFNRMFKDQGAINLKFTSALRMSATFPIIMPKVTLPTTPQISVMDAGMRDNFGSSTSYKYIHTFKDWIEKNTSGIIIISLRDKPKNLPIEKTIKSIRETFTSPLGSLYSNLFPIQDYNQDQMLSYLTGNLNIPIDIINFELNNPKNNISLSWHLTTKDKEKIKRSVNSTQNQKSINLLLTLLETN